MDAHLVQENFDDSVAQLPSTGSRDLSVLRTPLEVWIHILGHVIACPLIPSKDNSLVNNIRLFSYDREDFEDFKESEKTRGELRLVCKMWDAALKYHSNRYWRGPPSESDIVGSYSRMEQAMSTQWGWFGYRTPRGKGPNKPVNPSLVKAFVSLDFGTPMEEEISRYPNLELFAKWADTEGERQGHTLPAQSSTFYGLTHLQFWKLWLIKPDDGNVVLDLPSLRTLSIIYRGRTDSSGHKNTGYETKYHYPHFSSWNLPNLINLQLKGCYTATTARLEEDIAPLIRNVAPTLKGLSFHLREEDNRLGIPDVVWTHCHQLETIHCFLYILVQSLPPYNLPCINPGIRAIIRDLGDVDLYKCRDWHFYEDLILAQKAMSSFGMDIGWSTLKKEIEPCLESGSFLWLGFPHWFFHTISRMGCTFEDRYGLGMETEQAKDMIGWLESVFSSKDTQRKLRERGRESICAEFGLVDDLNSTEAEFTSSEDDLSPSEEESERGVLSHDLDGDYDLDPIAQKTYQSILSGNMSDWGDDSDDEVYVYDSESS